MKSALIILIATVLFSEKLIAQDFITPIIFEDAAGNFDTLYVGYDQNGTLGIDTSLGEENIIQMPRDSVFDVRASDESLKRSNNQEATFHTKRQIIPNPCNLTGFDAIYGSVISIDIKAQNWPVKMYWNNDFQNDCVDSSWVTTFPVGGWCDVICSPLIDKRIYAVPQQQIEINKPSYFDDEWCGFVENQDSIVFLTMALYDKSGGCSVTNVKETNIDPIDIFPNPVEKELFVKSEKPGILEIYSLSGREMLRKNIQSGTEQINVSQLAEGIYFYRISSENGEVMKSGKLVKQ